MNKLAFNVALCKGTAILYVQDISFGSMLKIFEILQLISNLEQS